MVWVLADVGGTNVRFACSPDLRSLTQVARYDNDAFPSFDAACAAYLRGLDMTHVTGLCIAVAGPVTGQTARLTNRDWRFDAAALSATHDGAPVHLINDLSALGYAVAHLPDSGVEPLNAISVLPRSHEQRLVVGVGTGMNVAPVLTHAQATLCPKAEAGLASPSARVLAALEGYVGARPPWAVCVEDVVSGPALGRLHGAVTGARAVTGRDVSEAAASGDAAALRTLDVFAQMVGALVQDLRLLYMPSHGVFLAGSVVRGLLASPARARLIEACSRQPTPKSTLPDTPLGLITQDEAALLGCLSYAVSVS